MKVTVKLIEIGVLKTIPKSFFKVAGSVRNKKTCREFLKYSIAGVGWNIDKNPFEVYQQTIV